MATRKNAIDIKDVNKMWGFYVEEQSVTHVYARCVQASINVSKPTVSKYIYKGAPARGIKPFRERHAEMKAGVIMQVRNRVPNEDRDIAPETMALIHSQVDQALVSMASDAIADWQTDLGRWVRRLCRLGVAVDRRLRPDMTDEDIDLAMARITKAARAYKDFAVTADLLKVGDSEITSEMDDLQRFLSEMTPEERETFEEHDLFPARLEIPERLAHWFQFTDDTTEK